MEREKLLTYLTHTRGKTFNAKVTPKPLTPNPFEFPESNTYQATR